MTYRAHCAGRRAARRRKVDRRMRRLMERVRSGEHMRRTLELIGMKSTTVSWRPTPEHVAAEMARLQPEIDRALADMKAAAKIAQGWMLPESEP